MNVREVATALAGVFEGAVRHHETRGKGGQTVPFHGDFANAPPSIVVLMRWWAREIRAAIEREDGPTPREEKPTPASSRCAVCGITIDPDVGCYRCTDAERAAREASEDDGGDEPGTRPGTCYCCHAELLNPLATHCDDCHEDDGGDDGE